MSHLEMTDSQSNDSARDISMHEEKVMSKHIKFG